MSFTYKHSEAIKHEGKFIPHTNGVEVKVLDKDEDGACLSMLNLAHHTWLD